MIQQKEVKIPSRIISFFCLNYFKKTIFSYFKDKFLNEKISRTTFYKYIPKNFISPKKRTDLCLICYSEESIKRKIQSNVSLSNNQETQKILNTINKHKEIVKH